MQSREWFGATLTASGCLEHMPPCDDRPGEPGLFDTLYGDVGGAPWDIRAPQDELVWAVWRGDVIGPRVLDVGCGAGDNAVLLAMHGFEVTAFDFHSSAVATARQRVAEAGQLRGSSPTVLQADVFQLGGVPEIAPGAFDTAVDSAVLHCIGDDAAQQRYVAALSQVVRSGGRLVVLAVSDENPDPWEGPPRRISEQRVRELLCEASGWRVEKVTRCEYHNRMGVPEGSSKAIFVVASRVGSNDEHSAPCSSV